MKDSELSPKNRERLRVVQTSGEHLLRMINEVLDFSKIEAGKMELATAPFHLPQLLRDIAAAMNPRAQQKEKCVCIKIHHGLKMVNLYSYRMKHTICFC
jgi:signal transduction histidine kinase